MTNRFRSLAIALAPHVAGPHTLIDAVDSVMMLDATMPQPPKPTITSPDGKAVYNWLTHRWDFHHLDLVDAAINDPEVMGHMRDGKKINAIKALRQRTQCSLREAKDAVDSDRMVDTLWAMR